MHKNTEQFSCIILAGGEGKRVGGVDKGLIDYKNKALIEHVIEVMKPQVDELVISANRNITRYKNYTDKVITDNSQHYLGPMAGINAALSHCTHDRVLVVPCDTPFLPDNLIEKFLAKCRDRLLYIAETENKLQPVMLIHKTLRDSIDHSLKNNELRLMSWVKSQQPEIIAFHDAAAFKSFNQRNDFAT